MSSPRSQQHRSAGSRISPRGFTLLELLISMAILSLLLIVLTSMTDVAHRVWRSSQSRTEAFQSARTSLEIMARELTPAVVDTRMQFVTAPGSLLAAAGAPNVVTNAPALLWMAPLGEKGDLRNVGYYLYRDEARKFYRLKRLFIGPQDIHGDPSLYFPKMVNPNQPGDATLRTSPVDATWFTRNWEKETFDEEDPANEQAVVSAAADGVVAFWVQCLDPLGRPVPLVSKDANHPPTTLWYNSAAYFQAATTTPFESGRSFVYLAESAQSMKANRVPAALDLTVVTIDSSILDRGLVPPIQTNVYDSAGALDVEASVRQYEEQLRDLKIYTARTFTTRARLSNGN